MPTLKLTLAYDGTNYHGWQRQARAVTIQGTIEDCLSRLTGERTVVAGAARTDAGVHALGQVAHFKTAARLDETAWRRALNALLPKDIAVVDCRIVPEGFHARRSAKGKVYRYRILNAPVRSPLDRLHAWHLPSPLDSDAMAKAAEPLIGHHDFTSYAAAGHTAKTATCTIREIRVVAADTRVTVWLEADRFLQHMVRVLVGTLVEVGRGRRPVGYPAEALAGRDRRRSGPTAPPHGLCLIEVRY